MNSELLKTRWWEVLLHESTAHALRERLLRDADPDLIIISAP